MGCSLNEHRRVINKKGMSVKTRKLARAALLCGIAAFQPAFAQETAVPVQAASPPVVLDKVDKNADKPWLYNAETKSRHLLPEVDGKTITVTKKNSVTKLDDEPTIVDANNLRGVFARLPGVLVSEQQTPSQANLSYRGTGNPQESEYVLALQDGIPLMSDLIGFPTLYYLPQPQTLESVQLIRGGSSLLYGPEPAPAINFVSRIPAPGQALQAYIENIGGSDGLFGSYNEVSKGWEHFTAKADGYTRNSDGQRANADYTSSGGDVHAAYKGQGGANLAFDLHTYHFAGGDAGRMSYTQFMANRDQTPTPYNHNWVDRTTGVVTADTPITDKTSATTKLWFGEQDIDHRTAAAGPTPASTTIESQQYRFQGIDSRLRHDWGRGNALTIGTTLYHSVSPITRYSNPNVLADRDSTAGTKTLDEDRSTNYAAVFAESVFRLPYRIHIVPSVRFEHEEIDIAESTNAVRTANRIPLVNKDYKRDVPLFGLGIGNDFGKGNETYASVSQGYRPLRYYDVSGPFSRVNPNLNQPDPQKSVSYELGVHGWPRKGLYYDISLFQIDFKDRIETQQLNAIDSVSVNTGNTRHRGVEAEGSFDLFTLFAPQRSDHLELFANASLLNATFVSSLTPGQVGKTPAYAPHYLARSGVAYRWADKLKLQLNEQTVGKQYWQDSNAAVSVPGAANYIPAQIGTYTVLDFSADYRVLPHLRLLGGVNNLTDRNYYARVFGGGLEPALSRTFYAGVALEL